MSDKITNRKGVTVQQRFALVISCKSKKQPQPWEERLLFWCLSFFAVWMILQTVTMILIIVTTIPITPIILPNILCTFHFIFQLYHLQNTTHGSSQNVLILAKGEPLTVLVTPMYIITYIKLFVNIINNFMFCLK